jgi:hypothetical protein
MVQFMRIGAIAAALLGGIAVANLGAEARAAESQQSGMEGREEPQIGQPPSGSEEEMGPGAEGRSIAPGRGYEGGEGWDPERGDRSGGDKEYDREEDRD